MPSNTSVGVGVDTISGVGPGVQVGGKTKPRVAAAIGLRNRIGPECRPNNGRKRKAITHKKKRKNSRPANKTHCSTLIFFSFLKVILGGDCCCLSTAALMHDGYFLPTVMLTSLPQCGFISKFRECFTNAPDSGIYSGPGHLPRCGSARRSPPNLELLALWKTI